MSHLSLEPALVSRLLACAEPVEIRDEAGNPVGHFLPLKSQQDAALQAIAAKLFDPKELERRKREEWDKGVPYSEVKRRLEERGYDWVQDGQPAAAGS